MKKIILTISIIFSCFKSYADKRCLIGKDLSEQELLEIKAYNAQKRSELKKLQELASQHPEDVSAQRKLKKKQDLLIDQSNKSGEIWRATKTPKDLRDCVEAKISQKQFKSLMEDYTEIVMRYPQNEDYVYNFKLLHAIIPKKDEH